MAHHGSDWNLVRRSFPLEIAKETENRTVTVRFIEDWKPVLIAANTAQALARDSVAVFTCFRIALRTRPEKGPTKLQ
jgi:hypothetical protein